MKKPPNALAPIMRENLLSLAHAYAKARGIVLATVGRLMHSDGQFFENLEKDGVSFTVRKHDEMVAKFFDKWPVDKPFPKLRDLNYYGDMKPARAKRRRKS